MSFSLFIWLAASGAAPQPVAPAVPPPVTEGRFISPSKVTLAQMRVKQQIIIRVPRGPQTSRSPMSDIRRALVPKTFSAKKVGRCMSMQSIRTVQVEGGRYLGLVTRDNRYIQARLEKSCQARSFHSGFYMQKSSDGQICTDRDLLQSRTGAKCEIDQFREIITNVVDGD